MVKRLGKHIALGLRIKEAIDSTGKNQSEFAKELGVEPPHLTRWLQGTVAPSYEVLIKIGNSTGVSLDKLIANKDVAPKELPFKITPEEIVYVEGLLKILRGANKANAEAIKWNVSAFSKTAGLKIDSEMEKPDVDAPFDDKKKGGMAG